MGFILPDFVTSALDDFNNRSYIDKLVLLILVTVGLAVFHFIGQCIYYAHFHHLRNFPGPFWARRTTLWARYQNLYGQRAHKIHAAHEKYGPVVRVAPNMLSFSDGKVVRSIYNSKAFVKEKTFYTAKKTFHENNLLSFLDPEAHHQRRKLVSRGFSQGALMEFEPQISNKIQILLDQWAKLAATGTEFDAYFWVRMFAFDVIYHFMFDVDPGTVRTGEEHFTAPWLRSWRNIYIYKEIMPSLERLGPYVPGPIGGYFRDVRKWKQVAVDLVKSCREDGTKTPFLSMIINGEDGYLGRPLTDSELAEECMGGLFAGSGTTATSFIYVLWACLRKHDVVSKLCNELDAAFPDGTKVPDSVACAKLPYMDAVLKETLRLYPATVGMVPRTAVQDVILDGYPIPRGANVGVQNFTIHRNPETFDQPENFDPDRWLRSSDTNLKEALIPFSVGPRKCLGQNLAEMELRMLIAAFFLRFGGKIHSSMKEEDMVLYDTFNASPIGKRLIVQLKERRRKD